MIAQLVQRKPRQFSSMHYTNNRRLVLQSILSLTSELERSLLRTILAGGGGGLDSAARTSKGPAAFF